MEWEQIEMDRRRREEKKKIENNGKMVLLKELSLQFPKVCFSSEWERERAIIIWYFFFFIHSRGVRFAPNTICSTLIVNKHIMRVEKM